MALRPRGALLMIVALLAAIPQREAEVIAPAAASSYLGGGPYGHEFCVGSLPETQSPIALDTLRSNVIGPSLPLEHTWTDFTLLLDPVTGKTILPGPISIDLKEATLQMNLPPGMYNLTHAGVNYTAVQMHWHRPAEHAVDGMTPQMELHVVHANYETGDFVVIGYLFNMGGPSDLLQKMMDLGPQPGPDGLYRPGVREYPNGIQINTTDWTDMEMALASSYFVYDGSLTTPPCSVGVKWIVLQSDWTLSVSREQLIQYETIRHQASGNITAYNARLPFVDRNRRVEFHVVSRSQALAEVKARYYNSKMAIALRGGQQASRKILEQAP